MHKQHIKILIYFFFLVLPNILFANTVWDISNGGKTATTSGSSYDNNTDISTTLSIPGATTLQVTITGETEEDYDFLYVTANGNTQTFDGNINTTYNVSAASISIRFTSDGSISRDGVTVTIADISNGAGWVANQGGWINLKLNKDFSLIYENNIKGDFVATGNTIMDGTGTLYSSNPKYLNQDSALSALGSSSKNRNSSSAPLSLPSDVNTSHIVWAGLFWQAQIHDNANNTNDVDNDIAGWNTVRMRTPDGIVHQITATLGNNDNIHSTYNYGHMRNGDYRFFYSAYADVTNIIKNSGYTTANNTFTVGNIMSTDGKDDADYIYFNHINEPAGQWYNNLRMGHFGGWSLVVVYDVDLATMNNNPSIVYKNVSIYNGYDLFSFWTGTAGDAFETTLNISGFKTPKDGVVSSKMLFFGGGGDAGIDKDTLQIEDGNNPTNFIDLTNSKNTGTQKFNGTYTNLSGNIIPGKNYFQGMDLDIFDTSAMMAHDQNSTKLKFGVVQKENSIDQVFPQVVAFSTELYQPEVCYDFVAKRNEIVIPYKDHTSYEAYAKNDDEISFTIAIWDIKGDIDPKYVSIALHITSQTDGHISAIENPDKAYYTFKNGNTLLTTDYADPMTTSTRPVITIGEGRTDNTGGIIRADEQYYSKFYFDVDSTNDGLVSGDYQVEVNATFNYGGGDFWQLMNVTRCPQSDTYTPTWVQFNVEKVFSPTVPTNDTAHYSLPTRIAGKDFDYSVASYTTNAGGSYTVPIDADGITVDVEMIDIGAFDDNNSQFKCGNSDPAIIVMPGNFVYFDNAQTRHNVIDPNDLTVTYPIKNTTFRMWLLADENGTLTSDASYHAKNDNTYFSQLYTDTYKDQDVKSLCTSACTPPFNYDSPRYPKYDLQAQGCYACLRDYFAQPYCARDNFAIRPKAIKVTLNDNDQDGVQTPLKIAQNDKASTPDNNVSIAAGYDYEMVVTAVDEQNNKAVRYYTTDEFKSALSLNSVPLKSDTNAALVKFEGNANCADQTHKTLFVRFYDGEYTLDANSSQSFNIANVGPYSFEIWDSNFTLVDNAFKNPHKTLFDTNCYQNSDPECNDCELGSTSADLSADDKVGCIFSSDQAGNDSYTKLDLNVNPYAYKLDVSLNTSPNTSATNWLYMNNLNAATYATQTQRAKSMAVVLEGNISAIGANSNLPLSNYTTSCAAQDVILWLDRNMSIYPESNILTEESAPSQVGFEQWLYSTVSGASQPVEDNMGNGDMNASLLSLNFKNEDNGSADLKLYYNFNKPYSAPVNPLDVNFTMLHAASLNAQSSANKQSNYTPDGNVSSLGDIWFVFAKVAPKLGDEYITTYDSNYTTYFRVNTFCIDKPGVNCAALQGLGILGPNEEAITTGVNIGGAWYRASTHNKDLDGNVTLSANTPGISELPVPLSSITFDNNGSTSDITLTYPVANARPKDFTLTLTPDEWLKYDPDPLKNGLPTFSIHYRTQGLRWKGEGDTGHVINTQPNSGENKRMNW